MKQTTIEAIVERYSLEYLKIFPPTKGYRNESYKIALSNHTNLNFILYKTEPGIKKRILNANEVSNYAAKKGLPTRQLYSIKIIKLKSGSFEQYGALYNYLPGQTIAWEAYTKDHIKSLGKTLSDLHAALKNFPGTLPSVSKEYLILMNQMEIYFSKPGVHQALELKLGLKFNIKTIGTIVELLKNCEYLKGKQALHMDFVRGNILFKSHATPLVPSSKSVIISGILDFEKTAYGNPIFDIARTLAFLLIDCKYKTETKIRKYFLISGYNKRGKNEFKKLTFRARTRKVDVLEELVNMFLLYDFYKFLRHNPYEFLNSNEHFRRTRDMLLARELLMLK